MEFKGYHRIYNSTRMTTGEDRQIDSKCRKSPLLTTINYFNVCILAKIDRLLPAGSSRNVGGIALQRIPSSIQHCNSNPYMKTW